MNIINQFTNQIKAQTLEIKAITSGFKEDVERNIQKKDQFTKAVGVAEKDNLESRLKKHKIMRKVQVDELWIYTSEKIIQNVYLLVRR